MPKMSFTVIELLPIDPARNLYRTRISVELKHDNNQPLDGDVKIAAPGREEVTISTDPGKGTGAGELLFISSAAVVVLVAETQIQGRLLTDRKPVTLKSKTAKAPDRLSVNTAGAEGKYIFIIGVMDDKNTPVPNIPISIVNGLNRVVAATGQTDQNGAFISQEITFLEKECPFLVIAGGLDPAELKLEGPSKWQIIKLPPADPDDTQHGWWHAIVTGWRRGRNAVKAARRKP